MITCGTWRAWLWPCRQVWKPKPFPLVGSWIPRWATSSCGMKPARRSYLAPCSKSSWLIPRDPEDLRLVEQVHSSHGAELVCVAEESSAWGNEADLAAVALYSSASSFCGVVVVDAVVIAAQHRQIRRCGVAAVFVGVDVVYLAPIGGHVAVWPGANEVFRGRHNPLFQRCKPGLVEVDGASRWVK